MVARLIGGESLRKRKRGEVWLAKKGPLEELELVHAWLAKTAHRKQRNLKARRLMREAGANESAAIAVGNGNLVLCPVAS